MERFDTVHVEGIAVECIVGIHGFERTAPQPLICDITVGFARRPGRFGASLGESIDYARLEGAVRFVLEHGHFFLLEDAAEALCATVLAPQAFQPARCSVTLRKPRALGGRCIPGVTLERHASECTPEKEHNHFGTVDVLHEGPACGVYVLRIPAGGSIPPHVHRTMAEAELVLGEGLLLNNVEVAAGWAHVWPAEVLHTYTNGHTEESTILCINRPRFDPLDEILVEVNEDALPDPAPFGKRYFGLP